MISGYPVTAISLEVCYWLYSLKSLKGLFICHKNLCFLFCSFDEVTLLRACICYTW